MGSPRLKYPGDACAQVLPLAAFQSQTWSCFIQEAFRHYLLRFLLRSKQLRANCKIVLLSLLRVLELCAVVVGIPLALQINRLIT